MEALRQRGRAFFARTGIPGWLRSLSKSTPGGRRAGTYALPILVAVASLGFEHAEAGILREPPVSGALSRPTAAELALLEPGLRRTAMIRGYAERYGIGWQLSEAIHDAAVHEDLDMSLAYRLVRVESSFKQGAIGPAGSIGFTQVQPTTARWLDPEVTREDLFDVETNLRLGFGYLRMLMDRYGDVRLALLAYNRGPGTVQAVMESGEDPANGYASRILGGLGR
jgi:Transglycosylase SLT domain